MGGTQEDLVCHDIELLLGFPLNVFCFQRTEHATQRAVRHRPRNRLARVSHLQDQRVELTGCTRMASPFGDQVLGQGSTLKTEHLILRQR